MIDPRFEIQRRSGVMSGVLKGVAGDSVVGLGANVRRQSEMISVAEGRRPGCHDNLLPASCP